MDTTRDCVIRIRTDANETVLPRPDPVMAGGQPPPRPATGARRPRPGNRRSRLVVFGLVWAALAIGFTTTWLAGDAGGPARDAPDAASPTATGTAAVLDPDPSAVEVPAPGAVPNALDPLPGPRAVGLVAARDDVWVQVSVDGAAVHEGVLRRGDRLDFEGETIDLVVSKPSAVEVTVDGAGVPPAPQMHLGA